MKFTYQLLILPLFFSLVSCGGGDSSTNNIVVEDTTPDAFYFIDQKGVAVSTSVESNTITVSGIDSDIAISITGGEYSIDGGIYTSATGSVGNGQSITVRNISSESSTTISDTVLTVGGMSDTFSITTTTISGDVTPDLFSFIDQTEVMLSTIIESNTIVISGITSVTSISITGGEYSLDGGAYTSASASVSNGQSIQLRHISSNSLATVTDTVLTVGGVSDTFSSTSI